MLSITTFQIGLTDRGATDFGRSVNPILTRRTDYAQLITTGTPGFSDLLTALIIMN